MIKNKSEMSSKIEIDLTGPQGNVYYLMTQVQPLLRVQGRSSDEHDRILQEMMSSDYDNAVAVFDKEFGDIVTLYK